MIKEKKTSKKKNESDLLIDAVVEGLQKKKGHDIMVMDFRKINHPLCNHFVICHGSSNVQVKSLAESVEEEVKKTLNIKLIRREGVQNAEWILLDYFDLIVHVFVEQARNFYKIENLWADADIKKIKSE